GCEGQTGFVISGPVNRPQQVAGLHEIVSPQVPGIVETLLNVIGNVDVGISFKEVADFLSKVNPSGNPFILVYYYTVFIFCIRQRSVISGVFGTATDGKVICLIYTGTEQHIFPVELFSFPVLDTISSSFNGNVFIPSGSCYLKLISVNPESRIQTVDSISTCRGFIPTGRCTIIVIDLVHHVNLILTAGMIPVIVCPVGGKSDG